RHIEAHVPGRYAVALALDGYAYLVLPAHNGVRLGAIEREHDAHDVLPELRVAHVDNASAGDAIVGIGRGDAKCRAGDVDDDLVLRDERRVMHHHGAVDADDDVGAVARRHYAQRDDGRGRRGGGAHSRPSPLSRLPSRPGAPG